MELQLNDSAGSRMAKLYTLDCEFLPGEDSIELSTFCVDSLKFGKSDSLRHLPQKNKNTYENFNSLYVKDDGAVLEKFARIPIDDDDHLRFTLVDRKNKKKSFDVDLSAFIKMYELHGDTFEFRFPDSTTFTTFTRDTNFDERNCDVSVTSEMSYTCYAYRVKDLPLLDTVIYCIVEEGDTYDGILVLEAINATEWGILFRDSSACKSQRFYSGIKERESWHNEYVNCYKIDLISAPESLSLSNLYSLRLMNKTVADTSSNSDPVVGQRHSWHTVTRLGEQGPDKEDDFTVYTIYKD